MLERKTVIDQIEVKRDGTVQVRLASQVVDGEDVLAERHHRMEPLTPGADLEARLSVVNAQFAEFGEAAMEEVEWDRVRRVVAMEHTADVVEAYAARQAHAEQPAADTSP